MYILCMVYMCVYSKTIFLPGSYIKFYRLSLLHHSVPLDIYCCQAFGMLLSHSPASRNCNPLQE